MKSKQQRAAIALCAALPAILILVGFNTNANSAVDKVSMTNRNTNAPLVDADNTRPNTTNRNVAMPMSDRNINTTNRNTSMPMSDQNTNTTVTDANNSRLNVRDRNDATLTPGDQGSSAADRDITQKVRQSIVSGTNNYSLAARNVKIITVNGKVTLRGPVNTAEEKAGIAAIAINIAGAGNVDNQLEVKTNP